MSTRDAPAPNTSTSGLPGDAHNAPPPPPQKLTPAAEGNTRNERERNASGASSSSSAASSAASVAGVGSPGAPKGEMELCRGLRCDFVADQSGGGIDGIRIIVPDEALKTKNELTYRLLPYDLKQKLPTPLSDLAGLLGGRYVKLRPLGQKFKRPLYVEVPPPPIDLSVCPDVGKISSLIMLSEDEKSFTKLDPADFADIQAALRDLARRAPLICIPTYAHFTALPFFHTHAYWFLFPPVK